MINFEKAIEISTNYFTQKDDLKLTKIYDSENAWIVFAEKRNQPKYGSAGISIDKTSGKISSFILPSRDNFELLKKSKLIEMN